MIILVLELYKDSSYKKAKVATALQLGKYFTKNGFNDVTELDL